MSLNLYIHSICFNTFVYCYFCVQYICFFFWCFSLFLFNKILFRICRSLQFIFLTNSNRLYIYKFTFLHIQDIYYRNRLSRKYFLFWYRKPLSNLDLLFNKCLYTNFCIPQGAWIYVNNLIHITILDQIVNQLCTKCYVCYTLVLSQCLDLCQAYPMKSNINNLDAFYPFLGLHPFIL